MRRDQEGARLIRAILCRAVPKYPKLSSDRKVHFWLIEMRLGIPYLRVKVIPLRRVHRREGNNGVG